MPEKSAIERHFQSGILTILVALVAWGGKTLIEVNTRTAVIEVALKNLESSVGDRYTGAEARLVNAEVLRRIERNEARLDRLERRDGRRDESH